MGKRHAIQGLATVLLGVIALGASMGVEVGAAVGVVPPAQYTGPPSTVGTDFWTTFGANQVIPTPDYIDLSGNTATTATVSVPGSSFTQDVAITPGSVTSVAVTGADMTSLDGTENLAVHITAGAPVSVYGLEDAPYSTDGFTALPVTAIGTDYYALGFDNAANPQYGPSDLQVVGTQNGTTVTITPSNNTASRTAGVPFTVSLDTGQVYELVGISGLDLTGTHISSSAPVSVLAGAKCANIPSGQYGACNYIAEQMPPTTQWGKDFVTEPLATRTLGDTFRVLADTNATTVTIDGATVATLDAGQFFETRLTAASVIHATAPVLVAQNSDGTSFDGAPNADPSEMLIPPDQQFLNSYTVATAPDSRFTNHLNVVAPNAEVGSVVVDGVAIGTGSFTAIGSSGFSGAQVEVSLGSHTVSGPQSFGLSVYGFGAADAYSEPGGYAAGQVANATYLSLSPMSQYPAVGVQACVTALIEDQGHLPLAGIGVSFAVTGANPTNGFASTQADGRARYCYTGTAKGLDTVTATAAGLTAKSVVDYGGQHGYRLAAGDGGVFAFGTAQPFGTMAGNSLNGPEVGVAATPDGQGYWLVAADGGVFAFGDAGFFGSLGDQLELNAPIVGIATTQDGQGYWLVAADGGVFAFGDAQFLGSLGDRADLNAPIVGMAVTPDSKGYWLVAADGGVFAYGDATFCGSLAGIATNAPVVAMARSVDGLGYWLVGADGGVFAYGDAPFLGSMTGDVLDGPEVGIAASADGQGYWLAATDGGVFAFGDAQFLGSLPALGVRPNSPIVALTS